MATLRFAKLHGTANDFVYVDAREGFPGDPAALAPRLCDRRRGIGADGLILLERSSTADCRMIVYNADGSRAEMCGNGIRGLAKFVRDRGLVCADPLRVETDAGVKTISTQANGAGRVARVTVDMGRPEWDGRAIPLATDGEAIERPLEVGGRPYTVTCVSMGNPHCVVFVDGDVAGVRLRRVCRRRRRRAHGPDRPTGGGRAPRRRARHRLAPRRPRPHDRRRGRGLRGAGGDLAMLSGAMTALVTPFRDGALDIPALGALVEAQIAGGINALVPCGSTGEAATLTHEEHLAVVREVVRVARGRVPVIAGSGSNSTAEAIRLTRGAEEAGA